VAARKDGTWEVVDGLQRLSTILQFTGDLRHVGVENPDDWHDALGDPEEVAESPMASPLSLTTTKYLPSLAGKVWESDDSPSLTSSQRLLVKRAKMDVKIIDRDSSDDSKYELFQRLNTGGSPLSDQEVRNVLLLMRSRERFRWIFDLGKSEEFQGSLSLSERLYNERYDLELMFRFIGYTNSSDEELRQFEDVGVFLDDWAGHIGAFTDTKCAEQGEVVRDTFGLIRDALDSDGFRRYSVDEHEFKGPFSVSAFEAISVGVGANLEVWKQLHEADGVDAVRVALRARIEELWSHNVFKQRARSGVRASGRVPFTVPLGRDIFAQA
jgi:hypothetical protein